MATGHGPSALAISADGRHAYISNYSDNTVSHFLIGADGDMSARGATTSVPALSEVVAIAISPDGKTIYEASGLSGRSPRIRTQ